MEKKTDYKKSYSQFGEDMILKTLFLYLFCKDITNIKYVDIGANYPIEDNNTYNLYLNGGSGILVEPNPYFIPFYKLDRPNDTIINAGIKFDPNIDSALYYDFGYYALGLNTFSEEKKNEVIKYHELKQTHTLPLIDVNDVLSKMDYIDFISLDVEGVELEVLKNVNFDNKQLRAKLFCIEANKTEIECGYKSEVTEFMENNGYIMVADNFTNIFYADLSQIKAQPSVPIMHKGKYF